MKYTSQCGHFTLDPPQRYMGSFTPLIELPKKILNKYQCWILNVKWGQSGWQYLQVNYYFGHMGLIAPLENAWNHCRTHGSELL